ncbi:tetratricopeptide repeat protein [Mucilaginibacter sp. BJC16-A38]|uniref:tetratricopeptide repeat protein n=1 Tax=Mucilaginibacter phenanthrenivorans TaxID=1234842 RepID=UPI002157F62B|nr:tetratricopeptide repeat protein [Mucilaginibacter phenanthrenivorans]MCR8557792.1 tetratricopeptide repeat protein [Mucilaginibacter phenanthrenivorans]
MDSSEQQTEKITRYIDGELTGDELKDFELLVNSNPALQSELQNFELAKKAVRHYGLKQQVALEHAVMMRELRGGANTPGGSKIIPFLRYTMRIAAVLLVMIIAVSTYEFLSVSPKNILSASEPYALSIERGAEQTSAIEKAYAEKAYPNVIGIFEKETQPAAKDEFLAGASFLALNQPAKAVRAFEPVVNASTTSPYKEDAEYYLGLSYLQNNEPAKAKTILEKIHGDKDHLYHDRVSYFTLLKVDLLMLKSGK